MEKTYTINELSLITGLTTRTLRNYLKDGILTGDKSSGIWKFTEEEINAFIFHPAVRPSIQAKSKAIVYDFLGNDRKKTNEICTILDFYTSPEEANEIVQSICDFISASETEHLRFSFENNDHHMRIILSGYEDTVHEIMNLYYNR